MPRTKKATAKQTKTRADKATLGAEVARLIRAFGPELQRLQRNLSSLDALYSRAHPNVDRDALDGLLLPVEQRSQQALRRLTGLADGTAGDAERILDALADLALALGLEDVRPGTLPIPEPWTRDVNSGAFEEDESRPGRRPRFVPVSGLRVADDGSLLK